MGLLTPRPGIMDITPYKGGESAIKGVSRIIKLASNEGPFGPAPSAVEAMKKTSETQHRYPDGGATALRNKLAAKYNIDAERIVCGAGSDELLGLLCRAYAGPGDEVLYSDHGFLMYPIAAKAAGATPVTAMETDLTTDVTALLSAVTEKTRIVFVANPNNPTGTYIPKSEMNRLRQGLRDNILLVIDAAYAEFMTEDDYDAGIELVERTQNTVMTRTFSKMYGLGGVRLGWSYASEEITDVLNRARNPFNVTSLALAAGEAALDDELFVAKTRKHNTKWLRWVEDEVRKLGLECTTSYANFALIRFPHQEGHSSRQADAFLRTQGIIVRQMAAYGLGDCLRVSIGAEDEMSAFMDALKEFMSK
ncbi:Histidinol-phosphate aminotransferase [Candidatus Terasakiella magnetica]|uniref:Histidinol-phosphate aminotransferase n=1 Tax=Candidatus Terasakiella magnetica TaxID=1867952 RepID=A0A1C3RDV3_9PROT|nr:histidinol-phosphate transaminase [Candidatus Terasakiella magnetica]SCA55473.1 Histidinol-phosphate aminotransferase [Candidatus Terasakiella magnetica]